MILDALKHLLATDPALRTEGLVGLVGAALKTPGHRTSHPDLPEEALIWRYPKTTLRRHAVTLTFGAAEHHGFEVIGFSLADGTTENDRLALITALASQYANEPIKLPSTATGRSSLRYAVLTDPPEHLECGPLESIIGCKLRMALTLTESQLTNFEAVLENPWLDRAP